MRANQIRLLSVSLLFLISQPAHAAWFDEFLCRIFDQNCSKVEQLSSFIRKVPSHFMVSHGGVHFVQGETTPFTGQSISYANERIDKAEHFIDGVKTQIDGYDANGIRYSVEYRLGKPHGRYKWYSPLDGELSDSGWFDQGEPVGVWKRKSDDTWIEYVFEKHSDGSYVGYRVTGEKDQAGRFKDGLAHGLWEHFHEDGSLSGRTNYSDGLYDGTSFGFYENGRLAYFAEYKNRAREHLIIYYSNGQVESDVKYLSGKPHGDFSTYYRDGTQEMKGSYNLGNLSGKSLGWFSNGNQSFVGLYDDEGQRHGEWSWYYENGKLKIRQVFKHGVLNGKWEEFDEKGSLVKSNTYENDKLIIDSK